MPRRGKLVSDVKVDMGMRRSWTSLEVAESAKAFLQWQRLRSSFYGKRRRDAVCIAREDAHQGIPGNEAADKTAKEAAKGKKDKGRSSIPTQPRTGRIALADYLDSINRAKESNCSGGWGRETVRHMLLECERWIELRTATWDRRHCPEDLKGILKSPELAQNVKATKFMVQTGLLG
ncbi:hypothetical protein MMC22_010231 [Lobaria immixta]|nr:hypothetical protein [Lobaria immixta]